MSSSERFIRGILVTLAEAAATNAAERVRAETEWVSTCSMSGSKGAGVKRGPRGQGVGKGCAKVLHNL